MIDPQAHLKQWASRGESEAQQVRVTALTGTDSCSHSEMFPLDHTYPEKIKLRRQILKDHPTYTVTSVPEAHPAVSEMYEWVFNTYLPLKMPQNFVVLQDEGVFWNKVTDEKWPLQCPEDNDEALRILGVNIEVLSLSIWFSALVDCRHMQTDLLVMEEIKDPASEHCGWLNHVHPSMLLLMY